MHDLVKKYGAINWEALDYTLEDFEARNLAYTYELIGQLARDGLIDLSIVKVPFSILLYLIGRYFHLLQYI
jgi:hypothetical protein